MARTPTTAAPHTDRQAYIEQLVAAAPPLDTDTAGKLAAIVAPALRDIADEQQTRRRR